MTLGRADRGSGTAGRSYDRARYRHSRLRQTGYVQGMIRRCTGGYTADQGRAARTQDRTGCRRNRGRRQRRVHCHRTLQPTDRRALISIQIN